MTRLALTVPLHDDEHADSFVSRVAAANGDTLAAFLRNMGLDHRRLANWDDESFRKLGYLAGVDPASLIERAVRKTGRGACVAGSYLPTTSIHRYRFRYCPLCVEADTIAGWGASGCRPYGRLIWLVDFITCCPVHEIALAATGEHPSTNARFDFSRQMANLSGTYDLPPRKPSEFEIYARRRLLRAPSAPLCFLDQHPLHVVVGICEAVGEMEVHGVMPRKSEFSEENWVEIRRRGFEAMSGHDDSFRKHVTKLADAARERTAMLMPRNVYGPLFTDLGRKLAHRDFDPFRRVIREVSVDRLPFGPENDVFGKLPTRKWHSLSSAAKEFGISTVALRKLLAAAGVIAESTRSIPPNCFLIDPELVASSIRTFRASLGEEDAMSYLNVPPHSWQAVLDLGGIKPLPVKKRRGASGTVFDVSDLDAFMMTLAAKGREPGSHGDNAGGDGGKLVNVLECREKAGCRLMDVLGLLHRGELRTVARIGSGSGLLSLHVDPAEVAVKATSLPGRTTPRHGVKPDDFRNPTNIRLLIEGGYLSTSVSLDEIADVRQAEFMTWSVELFHERYWLIRDLAEDAGLEPRHLKRQLSEAGVKPLLDEERITFAYYHVQEVEKATAQPGVGFAS